MALTSLLSVAASALRTHERAVAVTGHNIANAETPGYTRQRLRLAAASPERTPIGQMGRGVAILGIDRLRSTFLDRTWRLETGVESRYRTLAQTLEQATSVFGEPGEAGLGASLDRLIDAFHTLAGHPVDATARAVLLATATELTDRFHAANGRLDSLVQGIGSELGAAVADANLAIQEIARLNGQIRAAGGNAPDLMDRREQLLDRLAGLVDVQAIDRGSGTVDVNLGGLQLVSAGGGVQLLSVSGTGPFQLQIGQPPVPASVAQGRIRGLLDAAATIGAPGSATSRATGLRGQLDDLALAVVAAVNQIHSDYDPTTKPLQPTLTPPPSPLATIGPFFDPNGVTAATITLDAAILADPGRIAAGYSTAAGDNTVAVRLAELRQLVVPVPGSTAAGPWSPAVAGGPAQVLGDYYAAVVSSLGVATREASLGSDAQSAVLDHLEAQRQDVSGVSIDEEMVRLIEHQQAYTAAARLVRIADEMLRELVNIGR